MRVELGYVMVLGKGGWPAPNTCASTRTHAHSLIRTSDHSSDPALDARRLKSTAQTFLHGRMMSGDLIYLRVTFFIPCLYPSNNNNNNSS